MGVAEAARVLLITSEFADVTQGTHLVCQFHGDVPENIDDGDPDEDDHYGKDANLQ